MTEPNAAGSTTTITQAAGATTTGTADTGTITPGQNGDPAGTQAQEPGKNGDEKVFNQADVDRIVQERLAREQAKSAKEAEKARKEAEMTSLAEQQKFQELAVKRQERISELEGQLADLETAHEKAKRYAKALETYRDAMLANVPDPVKALLKDKDIADQLEWLSENAATFQPAADQTRQVIQAPRFPTTPAPNGAGNGLTTEEKRRQAYQPKL